MPNCFTPFYRPEIPLRDEPTLAEALMSNSRLTILVLTIGLAAFMACATVAYVRLSQIDHQIAMEDV